MEHGQFDSAPQQRDPRIIFEDLEEIAKHNDRESSDVEKRLFVTHLIDALQQVDGVYYEHVDDLYHEIRGRVIVRRENPEKAFRAIIEHRPIDIHYRKTFGEDTQETATYYNAAYWNGYGSSVGLQNAFTEGFSHLHGIVTVVGFAQGEHLERHIPEQNDNATHGGTLEYSNNLSLEGSIDYEDIAFLVVRIPAQYMSKENMTDEERELFEGDELPTAVFRGVLMKKNDASSEASSGTVH